MPMYVDLRNRNTKLSFAIDVPINVIPWTCFQKPVKIVLSYYLFVL